uniref:Uncharacterized protein n=2 Tax=Kalmanozyma brasiliensis (strain GHG001) TaxID=1365824 RepID=V5E3I6_KALBG
MPWKKVRINPTPAYEATPNDATTTPLSDRRGDSLDFSRSPKVVDERDDKFEEDDYRGHLGAFDDDNEQLLYAGADNADDSDPYASGNFDYAALQDDTQLPRYSSAVGFEAMTWMEGAWMSLSGGVVAVLMTVAILISLDVIDWPGDGLGNN